MCKANNLLQCRRDVDEFFYFHFYEKYFMGLVAESQSLLLLWSDSCSVINLHCCHGVKYIDVGTQLCYKFLILCIFRLTA